MGAMNKRMNLPALNKIMMEFQKQNAKMDQVEEMMGDAMDDVFEVRRDGRIHPSGWLRSHCRVHACLAHTFTKQMTSSVLTVVDGCDSSK
jgi:hypothetical protein